MNQTERKRIIFVSRRRSVLVFNQCALASGVVVDVLNESRPDQRTGLFFFSSKTYVYLVEKIRLVERWTVDTSIRRGGGQGPVQRIVRHVARKRAGICRRTRVPVNGLVVVRQQIALAFFGVSFEVVSEGGGDSGAIINLIDTRQVIPGVTLTLTIDCALRQSLHTILGDVEFSGPSQFVIGNATQETAAVPGANRLSHNVIQHPTLARFHARLVYQIAKHVVVITHHNPPEQVIVLFNGVTQHALIAFDV